MNFQKLMILTIALGLIVSAVSAIDQIIVTSDKDWMVANGADTATITVRLLNGGTGVGDYEVTLKVDPTFGSIKPGSVKTDATGTATATLTTNRTSGTAVITAQAEGILQTYAQPIDHDIPYRISRLLYDSEVTVGNTTTIILKMTDRYGNAVDDRREREQVSFYIGSISGDARFLNGTEETDTITRQVDENGSVFATLRTDRYVSGHYRSENLVLIDPLTTVPDKYITIYGIANGIPANITCSVEPEGDPIPYVPADGASTFYITARAFDQYGNPSCDQDLVVRTNLTGEDLFAQYATSSTGEIFFPYGLKDTPCTVNLTVYSGLNMSAWSSRDLLFYNASPVKMLLTVNPETMPSADVPSNITTFARAKIVDIMGRPVAGESVSFSITAGDYPPCQVMDPFLIDPQTGDPVSYLTGTTDDDGYALVEFVPGRFTIDPTHPNYTTMASGDCLISARWGEVYDSVEVSWKNYPYISVETGFDPPTAYVNETVNFTIRIVGDGWQLQQLAPIDVMVLIDRGEDMLLHDAADQSDGPDRMIYARAAAYNFTQYVDVDLGNQQKNRVGFIPYGDMTTHDQYISGTADILNLSTSYNWVKNAGKDGNKGDDLEYVEEFYPGNAQIWYNDYAHVWNSLKANNGESIRDGLWEQVPLKNGITGEPSAPLRYGLYTAIKTLEATPPSSDDTVRAIVVLLQNRYCYFGSPFGQDDGGVEVLDPTAFGPGSNNYVRFDDLGDQQNLAKYAKERGIMIFPIYYAWSNSQAQEDVPRRLASESGGEYFFAGDHVQLEQAFADVAERLKKYAGVNTTLQLDLSRILVNDADISGYEAFDYVHIDGRSTHIRSYMEGNESSPLYEYTQDDTPNWTAGQKMNYDIGTILLDQVWEANFCLRLLKDGMTTLQGANIIIGFDDGSIMLAPNSTVSVLPLDATGPLMGDLDISNLHALNSVPVSNSLTLAWDITYTGSLGANENIECSMDSNTTWLLLNTRPPVSASRHEETILDLRSLPGGNYTMTVRVRGDAPDAPSDSEMIPVQVSKKNVFIKIE